MSKYTKAGQVELAKTVTSLLDIMKDGVEYQSIAGKHVRDDAVIAKDVQRAIGAIQQIRKRPCLCYFGNIFRPWPETSITLADHLPFAEMVRRVDQGATEVDLVIVTAGGIASSVTQCRSDKKRAFRFSTSASRADG